MSRIDVSGAVRKPRLHRSRSLLSSWLRILSYYLAGALGIAGVVFALYQLLTPAVPLRIQPSWLDRTPITVFSQVDGEPGPAIVLVHEFAGSQQLMLPFAVTLARNGYTVVTFDFPGHGRNGDLLRANIADRQELIVELSGVLDNVVTFARNHPLSDGRVALLGHALGADTAIFYAQQQDQIPTEQIDAVVAISLDYAGVVPNNPRNLLVLNGALEVWLLDTVWQVTEQSNIRIGETSGDFRLGTARRVQIVPWVEHIGVLFNPTSLHETQDWFDQSFQRQPAEDTYYLDNRVWWIGLLYVSAIVLFWPFSLLLRPVVRQQDRETESPVPVVWKWWVGLAVVPAVITPILVRLLPVDGWLHILVGGPLALHFGIYGVLTGIGLIFYRFKRGDKTLFKLPEWRYPQVPIAMALLVVGYIFMIVGVPDQLFVFNYFPPVRRILIAPLVFLVMLPYFLADEHLSRSPGAPVGAYVITKVFFILSLCIDALLSQSLFFLFILAPLFALYFVVYGLFSGRVYQRTRAIAVSALVNTFIFAWTVTAIFPLTA